MLCWDLNPGPRQEQQVLLTTESAVLPSLSCVSVCPCIGLGMGTQCTVAEEARAAESWRPESEVAVSCLTWVPGQRLKFFKHSHKQCELVMAKPSLEPQVETCISENPPSSLLPHPRLASGCASSVGLTAHPSWSCSSSLEEARAQESRQRWLHSPV